MLETAKTFLLHFLLENEEVKKFPNDFVTASMKWIRSWFLTDEDPIGKSVLESAGNESLKKIVVEQKLSVLLENETFKRELQGLLATYETEKKKAKNVIEHSNIAVQGGVHVGDQGQSSGEDYDQKNVIKGSTIKAGRDFRLGDDIVQAGGNIHYGDVHYHAPTPTGNSAAPVPTSLAKTLRQLIASGRTAEAIPKLVEHAENHAPHLLDDVLQLSARWESLKRKERIGVMSHSDANVERNQVNGALLEVIGELGG